MILLYLCIYLVFTGVGGKGAKVPCLSPIGRLDEYNYSFLIVRAGVSLFIHFTILMGFVL